MSTELTPFAEVTAPGRSQGDGPADTQSATEMPVAAPDRALGRLAVVADWFSTRLVDPTRISRPRLLLIAGDHEGPDELSPDAAVRDASVTRRLAELAGVGLRDVDVASRDVDLAAEFAVVAGHRSPRSGEVLTREQAIEAIDIGRRIADQEIDGGADLLIPGLLGQGHAVALGVIVAVLTGLEPVDAIGLPDADVQTWSNGVTDLRDALFALRDTDKDVISLLSAVGGADLAVLTGLIAQAAARRTVVLVDGQPAVVAAVLAHRLAPGAESWIVAAGEATTRTGRRLQELLWLSYVAMLGTDSPTGGGAVLVLPLVRAALAAAAITREASSAETTSPTEAESSTAEAETSTADAVGTDISTTGSGDAGTHLNADGATEAD